MLFEGGETLDHRLWTADEVRRWTLDRRQQTEERHLLHPLTPPAGATHQHCGQVYPSPPSIMVRIKADDGLVMGDLTKH